MSESEASEQSIQSPAGPQPADAPRAVTPVVSSRSWHDPRVRLWWLGAIGLAFVAGFFLVSQMSQWNKDRKLATEGTPVEAIVRSADGLVLPAQKAGPNAFCELTFTYKGTTQSVKGVMFGRKEQIIPQSKVTIKIDPADPQVWTYRTEAPGVGAYLVGGLYVVPLPVILGAFAIWQRKRVLRTWTSGKSAAALVTSATHAALAPTHRTVRCVLADGSDKNVYTVFVPLRAVSAQKGDMVWVILPPGGGGGRGGIPIAASAFQ